MTEKELFEIGKKNGISKKKTLELFDEFCKFMKSNNSLPEDKAPALGNNEHFQRNCPECGSSDTQVAEYHCNSCGEIW